MTYYSKSQTGIPFLVGSILLCLLMGIAAECDADTANESAWHTYTDAEYGFSLGYNPEWTSVDRSDFAEITINNVAGDGIHLVQLPEIELPDCNDIVTGEAEEGSDTYPTDCLYIPIDRGKNAVLIDSKSSTGEDLSEIFFPSPSGTWIMAATHLTTRDELIRVVKSVRFLGPVRK